MRSEKRRHPGKWECSKDCPNCEGEGRIFSGYTTGFDTINMEVVARDLYVPCQNAEWEEEEPEYDKYKGRE